MCGSGFPKREAAAAVAAALELDTCRVVKGDGRVVTVPEDEDNPRNYPGKNGFVKKALKKAWKRMRGSSLDISSTADIETSSYVDRETIIDLYILYETIKYYDPIEITPNIPNC
ncbi:UNVERIFIED_CONTAM: hypothetical protein PYX00_007216 [Menopon gallinae]|uniref:Uncharacterized protein n=1 Tax=Menopon gallinae TaxID=328185 RepID=A0AAW2HJ12_9NEOP